MKNESWQVGETICNGVLVSIWEDEDGYFIKESSSKKNYINIGDYELMWY
jgi:hypothetical protein